MSYITTYTGKHIDPIEPEVTKFDIHDIAHALSLICRGNGHVKTFFSVGQHCINCALEAEARGYTQRVVLACLIHDASEAYLSDVPRPFKQCLPQYRQIEDNMLVAIYERFLGTPLTKEEEELVRWVDNDMLYYDMRELLGETIGEREPQIRISLDYTVRSFAEVERQYLALYEKCCKNLENV